MSLLVDDRDLLARFRQGDPSALDRVYRHFAPHVIQLLRSGFMYSTSGQSARHPGFASAFDLESAVQETFTRAFDPRARATYDGLRPYSGFLLGIARRVALDALRQSARRRERIEPPDAVSSYATIPVPGEDLAADVDQRRAEELVRAFLADTCSEQDLRLYRLRYEEDRSQEATASDLGLTRIQVRRWERKFRERLLRYLKRADYVREP